MNLKQLIDAVNEDMEESYPNITVTRWLNEGYVALSDIVKPTKKTILTGDVEIADMMSVKMLFGATTGNEYKALALNDMESSGYLFESGGIELRNIEEPLMLYYYTELQPMNDPTESPKIPQQFHDMLVHYAVARLQFTEEELETRPDRMNGYNNRIPDLQRYYREVEMKNKYKKKTVTSKVVW